MFDIRALNHSRKEFLPTYIGMRMLLSAPGSATEHLEGIVRSRLLTKQLQTYKNYNIYKSTNENGKDEYRQASAASPLTLLGESYVLGLMSQDKVFANFASTYSYEWPSVKSTQMWQYYYKGFQRRSDAVKAQIEGSQKVILVMDIKRFYPSVLPEKCLRTLEAMLALSSLVIQEKKMIYYVAESALASAESGLPIGPPISHALGNVFLRKFDERMQELFGKYYHRYVDDIAIVTDVGQVNKIVKITSDLLKNLGLSLNKAKTHVINAAEWSTMSQSRPASESFGSLREKITAYLAVRPYKERFELRSALREAGFNLPIAQFSYSARSVGYISFLSNAFKYGSLKALLSTQREIVKSALEVRKNLNAEVLATTRLIDQSTPYIAGVLRKRLINIIGLLLYMYPVRELGANIMNIPKTNDAANLRALINGLITGDATHVLSFPGSTANTFAQIWSESEIGLASVNLSSNLETTQLDAAFSLCLYNVISFDDRVAGTVNQPDRQLLGICMGKKPQSRYFSDLSYIDEVQSLRLGANIFSPSQFLFDRRDNDQEVGVEGLDLATDYD